MKTNAQNAKIAAVTEKLLITGIDVGSWMHFTRAFGWWNYEYSRRPLEFRNDEEGFKTLLSWINALMTRYGKDNQRYLKADGTGGIDSQRRKK